MRTLREELRQRMRVAGDVVAGADADQHRRGDVGEHRGLEGLARRRARRRRAAARSLRVDSAKPRKILSVESSMSSMRSISMASARPRGRPEFSMRFSPMPPRIRERTRSGAVERQHRADASAERIAHDVGARDRQMVEQMRDVRSHQVETV